VDETGWSNQNMTRDSMTRRISIGIMAHNEEAGIAATLTDLLAQDALVGGKRRAEILVLVNGSRDRTAEVAGEILERQAAGAFWSARVLEITKAGKANAWNEFVHRHSPKDAEVLICMDADIRLPRNDTLSRLLRALDEHPEALAAVDEPVKSISLQRDQGIRDQLSLAAAKLSASGPPKLCGQLYAARAEALRRIFLPEPMLVEDGFIKAMLTTDGFQRPERSDALVRAAGAFHLFEAETRLADIFRHEKRIITGTICNLILFERLRGWAAQGANPAGELRTAVSADQDWLRRLIARDIRDPQRHRDMWNILSLPLRQWRGLADKRTLSGLVAALVRSSLNLPLVLAAYRDLRRNVLRW
jgi:glycosyltransferase involved in cell wall biosynthesis